MVWGHTRSFHMLQGSTCGFSRGAIRSTFSLALALAENRSHAFESTARPPAEGWVVLGARCWGSEAKYDMAPKKLMVYVYVNVVNITSI